MLNTTSSRTVTTTSVCVVAAAAPLYWYRSRVLLVDPACSCLHLDSVGRGTAFSLSSCSGREGNPNPRRSISPLLQTGVFLIGAEFLAPVGRRTGGLSFPYYSVREGVDGKPSLSCSCREGVDSSSSSSPPRRILLLPLFTSFRFSLSPPPPPPAAHLYLDADRGPLPSSSLSAPLPLPTSLTFILNLRWGE